LLVEARGVIVNPAELDKSRREMTNPDAVRITAHRHNIGRFQRMLRTELNEPDRRFVRSHLAEEKASLAKLVRRGAGALGPAEGPIAA
jgi:hypothetical protein